MIDYLKVYWVFGFGFLGQAIFGLRIVFQWWAAEQKGQVVSPSLFWRLSLLGSALFLVYGILRNDIVIIIGQSIAYFIYVRNLQLKKDWLSFPAFLKVFLIALPFVAFGWMLERTTEFKWIEASQGLHWNAMLCVGIFGQLLLNYRFFYQLYYSEKRGESILPIGFWWISFVGAGFVTIYAIYRRDPVLFVAQSLALVPYVRNIVLSRR